MLTAIRALPDVEQAGLSEDHFISSNPNRPLTIEGGTAPSLQAGYPIARQAVDPQYFQTLRIPVLSGTTFSGLEHPDAPPSAVINNVMARRFWPGQNAVGKRFKLAPASSNGPWFTVIGVVGDMRRQAIERDPIPQVFVPFTQDVQRTGNILIRTKGDPLAAVESVRQAIRGVTRTVPMPTIVPLETRMDAWLQQARFQTSLFTIFSVLALLMAAIGIYGLMSYSVAQRSREIGIRMALGARVRTILFAILSEGMLLAAVGIVLGLGASFGVSRFFSALLYGVQPDDVATFVIAPLVLLGIAALATYLPARRAASIDPASTLR